MEPANQIAIRQLGILEIDGTRDDATNCKKGRADEGGRDANVADVLMVLKSPFDAGFRPLRRGQSRPYSRK